MLIILKRGTPESGIPRPPPCVRACCHIAMHLSHGALWPGDHDKRGTFARARRQTPQKRSDLLSRVLVRHFAF